MPKPPVPRLTVITLGVADMRRSIAFYEALGFVRKFRATGEAVAFFDTGATVIGLFPWDQLAQDATLPEHPRPRVFRASRWPGTADPPKKSMRSSNLRFRKVREC